MMQINTTYSFWWVLPCLLAAAAGAWLLYSKSPFGDEVKKNSLLYIGLLIIRFVSFFLLAFLLLAPFIKTESRKVQKPIIVVALDNSESIKVNKDSLFYTKEYPKKMEGLISGLQKDFDVKVLTIEGTISEQARFDFIGKQTHLSALFTEIEGQFENQNLGAVIVASDGLYNVGANPVYAAENVKAPIFTIALGDTTVPRDALVKNVRNNKIAYLGNTFPVEITVEAGKLMGNNATLTVTKNGTLLYTKPVAINNDNFSLTENLQLSANEAGTQHYVVQLSALSSEVSYANNRKDFFIEVLDGRNKILLLGDAPHPDMAAIKQAIESNQNYEVIIAYTNTFAATDLKKYNLVILHQLPTFENPLQNILEKMEAEKMPYLSIVGTQTAIPAFNNLTTGVAIENYRNNTNDALPLLNDAFALFTLTDETKKVIMQLPPLKAPFGNYSDAAAANTLLYQQIGAVKTQQPLLFFGQNLDRRVGVLLGEGFWRWRLHNYQNQTNHAAIDELMTKTVQYLSAKNDTRKFRVNAQKNMFNENDKIIFDAQVYNESYEAITLPDVKMEIKDENGKVSNYVFGKTANAYSLNVGFFGAGIYSYTATVVVGNNTEKATGKFTVIPLQAELLETVANHQLMQALAAKNGGKMVYTNQIDNLIQLVKAKEDIKPVSYIQTTFKDIINLKWVFFVLLVLFSAEWFLRRRNGAY